MNTTLLHGSQYHYKKRGFRPRLKNAAKDPKNAAIGYSRVFYSRVYKRGLNTAARGLYQEGKKNNIYFMIIMHDLVQNVTWREMINEYVDCSGVNYLISKKWWKNLREIVNLNPIVHKRKIVYNLLKGIQVKKSVLWKYLLITRK